MTTVPASARSEEHLYDPRFIKRWADICIERHKKYGQKVANDFARQMFSPVCLREINQEIERRNAAKKK